MISTAIVERWLWRLGIGLMWLVIAGFAAWVAISAWGCHGLARSLGAGATDNLAQQIIDGVSATIPPPTPSGNVEEIVAIAGGAVAVIIHRMWYHRKLKG